MHANHLEHLECTIEFEDQLSCRLGFDTAVDLRIVASVRRT